MAGRVPAHLEVGRDGQSWTIVPSICPVADEHRHHAAALDEGMTPKCQSFNYGHGRRTCPFWYATTSESNAAERLDGAVVWERAAGAGRSQIRCGVLCIGARRNRPPGV